MAKLTNKHGPVTEFSLRPAATFDLDCGMILQASGKRVVGVFWGGTSPLIFQLSYYDGDLAELAEEEGLQFAQEGKLRL